MPSRGQAGGLRRSQRLRKPCSGRCSSTSNCRQPEQQGREDDPPSILPPLPRTKARFAVGSHAGCLLKGGPAVGERPPSSGGEDEGRRLGRRGGLWMLTSGDHPV